MAQISIFDALCNISNNQSVSLSSPNARLEEALQRIVLFIEAVNDLSACND